MRHLRMTVVVLAMAAVLAGCKKPEGPKTVEPTVPMGPTVTSGIEGPEARDAAARPQESVRLEDLTKPPKDVQPPTTPDEGRKTYTIEKGDTLWSIAKRYLGNGKRYTEIIAANPGLDAAKLKVGQQIVIPPK